MAVESQSLTIFFFRLKLLELGKLCGLMPKSTPSSQQIHLVVELSAGIQDDEEEEERTVDIRDGVSRLAVSEPPSVMAVKRKQHPVEKLKEALSSKKAFQKCYLVRKRIPLPFPALSPTYLIFISTSNVNKSVFAGTV